MLEKMHSYFIIQSLDQEHVQNNQVETSFTRSCSIGVGVSTRSPTSSYTSVVFAWMVASVVIRP